MKGWYPVAMGWDRAGRNRDRVRTSETGRGRDIACDRGGSLPGGFGRRWWMWRHSGKGELARARTIGELDTAIITLLEADWSLPAASVPISCMINLSVCVCQVSVFVHVCVCWHHGGGISCQYWAQRLGEDPQFVFPLSSVLMQVAHAFAVCVCVCEHVRSSFCLSTDAEVWDSWFIFHTTLCFSHLSFGPT